MVIDIPRDIDKDIDRAKTQRGPETFLYEYQEWWQDILSGKLGPLLIAGLILSLIIAGILAANDIGFPFFGNICFGNLGIVCFGWFAFLIIGIILNSLFG